MLFAPEDVLVTIEVILILMVAI